MNVNSALKSASKYLISNGIERGAREARILMAHVLGLDRARLTLHLQDELNADDKAAFEAAIAARGANKPISHIIGGREFYGRWFKVTPDVLDPRPDTETLIDLALQQPFTRLLDLGTGSGAIIVTLLAQNPQASGVATDISGPALSVAKSNAFAHGVRNVSFEVSDWFQDVGGQFDLIVSNPPYIAVDELPELAPDVRDHEPRIALTEEGDGLSAYRIITAQVMDHLTPKGRAIVEIGATQAEAVMEMFASAGLSGISQHTDMNGKSRVICGVKSG